MLPQGGSVPGASTLAAPAAAPTPALQSLDVAAPSVEAYTEAVRGLGSALERARALQAALTEAKTAAEFENIAKAAFPQVALEQYEDQLVTARTNLDALAKSSGEAYDPERLRIAVELQSRLTIQERELDQIRADAKKKLKPEELKKLEEDLTKRKTEFVAQLQKEKKLREELLPLVRAQAAVEGLRRDTAAIPFDLQRAGAQAAGAMAGAYGRQDDPVRARMIEAESRIAERRIQEEEKLGTITAGVARELAEYAAAQRAAAQTLGELDQSVADFINVVGTIREVSKTMTDGFKGFFKEILSGGDIQGAMNSMLQNITDKFLSMALDAAFSPMEQLFTDQLKNIFGIEDPAQKFQEENTSALAAVATTQEAASSTQQRAADTQLRAAELQLQAATSGTMPGAPRPMSQQVDSVMGPNGQPVPLNQGTNNSVNLSVEPFNAAADNATSTLSQLATQAADSVTALPNFTQSVTAFSATASATEQNLRTASSVTSQLSERFGGLTKAAGSAMSVLGGLAMGVAGLQQMKKGGIYNTLMGIAGVFGAISSVAGGIAGIGGAIGGGGGGGGGIGGGSGFSSFDAGGGFAYGGGLDLMPRAMGGPVYAGQPYMVGERGAELFVPQTAGSIIPNSPYAATASALEGGSGFNAGRLSNEPIKIETRVINGVEYATTDQLQQATRQAETRGAERGRALALGSMRNSIKTRKQLGMS